MSSYDLGVRNIVPYIRKYGKHPVTGVPLKQEDLIPLTFHKNAEGSFLLPTFSITFLVKSYYLHMSAKSLVYYLCTVSVRYMENKVWRSAQMFRS